MIMALNKQELNELKEIIGGSIGELETSIIGLLDPAVENAIRNAFSEFEFILPDGTRVIPKKKMRLTSPDKTKVLVCYGGLCVEDTGKFCGRNFPDGWGLSVQTGIDSWEIIHVYNTKDEAIGALEKVKCAVDSGVDSFEL